MRHLLYSLFLYVLLAPTASGQSLSDRLSTHVHVMASDSLEGRGLGTVGKDRATAYLVRHFEAAGLTPLGSNGFVQAFPLRFQLVNVEAYNVVGMLEGSDPALKEEYIVLGAHYDHLGFSITRDGRTVFPGADDNASGTAALIELARLMASAPSRPARSIIFAAFDAEESGLLGAEEFVRNPPVPLPAIKAMFSLDMVGMLSANGGLTLTGMGTLENGIALARSVAERHTLALKGMSATLERRTDTWPFGREGIPAIHAFTGLTSPYHKPEDTADLLDYSGMETVVHFLQDLVVEMANRPALSPSRALLKLQRPIQLGMRLGVTGHIGSAVHDYADAFYRSRAGVSGSAGLLVQLQITRSVVLQTEALYDLTRSSSALGTLSRHALTIPMNVQVNTFSEPGLARTYVFAGPYYRHVLNGKDGPTGLDLETVHQRSEWGASAGFGLEVYGVQLGYTRRYGGTSLLRKPGETIRSIESYFSMGYRF